MGEKNKILYVQTSDNPERQYSPLVLAQSAKAMNIDAIIYYLGQGLRALKPDIARSIKLGDFPSIYHTIKAILSGLTSITFSARYRA